MTAVATHASSHKSGAGRAETLADLLGRLGNVPPDRVRMLPVPGTATAADALAIGDRYPCELVNGTIVEKPVGMPEDYVGFWIAHLLLTFVAPRRLGMVQSSRTMFRMSGTNLREPDASFTRQERLPNPLPQVGGECPDLCVEVLSPSNTPDEMAMKRAEYFASGCQLVWEVNMEARTVSVFTRPDAPDAVLAAADTLDGGAVLSGFTLRLADLWAELDALAPPQP